MIYDQKECTAFEIRFRLTKKENNNNISIV